MSKRSWKIRSWVALPAATRLVLAGGTKPLVGPHLATLMSSHRICDLREETDPPSEVVSCVPRVNPTHLIRQSMEPLGPGVCACLGYHPPGAVCS